MFARKLGPDKNRTKLKKNLKYVSVDTFLYQGVSFFFLLKNKKCKRYRHFTITIITISRYLHQKELCRRFKIRKITIKIQHNFRYYITSRRRRIKKKAFETHRELNLRACYAFVNNMALISYAKNEFHTIQDYNGQRKVRENKINSDD